MSTKHQFTPQQILSIPASELAYQSAETLFQIKTFAADLLSTAKAVSDHVDQSLDLKWSDRARSLRQDAGKDAGVIHFDDGDVHVTADLPKKVEWNQTRLAEITRRIAESGEDVKQYVEISYRVSETKFNAWPQTLKTAFESARTVKCGKASYRLALVKEES